MFFAACLCGLLSLPFVRADGWDDFSNNLATDLAPFISLFGEQVTKQYLSESITSLDYFIFAMAPMGILTAVVSAIRVCGSPSLRAFIGRAQEGGGNAEAELCSSTSRDVCELYNNGGIARVFGRPKILEVVYDPTAKEKLTDGTAGIYTFREFIKKDQEEWSGPPDDSEHTTDTFAPNLSLNVGIKRKPSGVFWAVAMAGMILQVSVLVFAVVVTYYLRWEKGGNRPESYACPLTIVGTLIECGGIFLCAYLVGQSTNERVFHRKRDDRAKQSTGGKKSAHSSIFWVQPGGQVLGDQVFDPFCCSDSDEPLQQYIISWKNHSKTSEFVVWAAVGTTGVGFVLQFVGLRGLHSAVSVAQLGVTIVMSAARATLRMQRLKPEDNFLSQFPDEVVGHELDWLAIRIGGEDVQRDSRSSSPALSSSASSSSPDPSRRHLWRFRGSPGNTSGITTKPPLTLNESNVAGKLLAYRTRLAQLTQSRASQTKAATPAEHFDVGMVEVREHAQRLALAIESSVNTIFSKAPKIRQEWKDAKSMFWSFHCDVVSAELCKACNDTPNQHTSQHILCLRLTRESSETPWRLQNKLELEALLGLWVWSLKSDPMVEVPDSQSQLTVSQAAEIPTRRIVSTSKNIAETDLNIWLGSEISSFQNDTLSLTSIQGDDPSTIWEQDKSYLTPFQRNDPSTIYNWDKKVRFFGWHATKLPHSHTGAALSEVWSASTNGSFTSLCAQEVFGSFVASVLDIVDDIGDINIQGTLQFRLESSLVSEIVNLFTKRQLGSTEDALLCVLPPMIPRLKLPSTESVSVAARRNANQHRKRDEWIQAEAVLRWAWRICSESQPHAGGNDGENDRQTLTDAPTQQVAIALGELYRWALRGNNDIKEFGLRGIDWLSAQKISLREGVLGAVGEIIGRYDTIAEEMKQGNSISGSGLPSGITDDLKTTLLYLTQSISITNEDKGKGLCLAAKRGWAEVVLALLELGAEPDFKDTGEYSRTALSQAAQINSIDTMKELIAWGAFPNSADAKHRTPLSYAAETGSNSAVKILLEDQRVEVDAQDENRRTPLWCAARNGHEAVVKLLMESGKVDLEAEDEYGRTPLSWAVKNGQEAVVKLLMESGKVDL
ncbi:ankyrin repeat-containing domain-containing, partial [Trichoderma arundinaceum]